MRKPVPGQSPARIFVGAQVGIQGADFFGPGGCPNPVISLSQTFRVVIG